MCPQLTKIEGCAQIILNWFQTFLKWCFGFGPFRFSYMWGYIHYPWKRLPSYLCSQLISNILGWNYTWHQHSKKWVKIGLGEVYPVFLTLMQNLIQILANAVSDSEDDRWGEFFQLRPIKRWSLHKYSLRCETAFIISSANLLQWNQMFNIEKSLLKMHRIVLICSPLK